MNGSAKSFALASSWPNAAGALLAGRAHATTRKKSMAARRICARTDSGTRALFHARRREHSRAARAACIGRWSMTQLQPRLPSSTAVTAPLFDSVFLGGFECSCQKRENGQRLDMISATRHDELVELDYERLRAAGMTGA